MLRKIVGISIKVAALVAAVLLHGTLQAQQMESARDLLSRMAKASKELNYQGLVTYEYQGNLSTVKVVHVVRDGETFERVIHLDGPEEEIIRRGDSLDCLRTGDMLLRGGVVKISNDSYSHLEDFYDFYIKGEGRIAGRAVKVVYIMPKDKHRYGYILAIDKESGLMLQSVLMNHAGKPLERFQFSDIHIGAVLDDADFLPEKVGSQVIDVDTSSCLKKGELIEVPDTDWKINWIPPGFMLASHHPAGSDGQETMMFTDGLAVFSLFIDSSQSSMLPQVDAKLGATVAVLTKADFNNRQYAVCVVGEIPRITAHRVAEALSPIGDSRIE